MTVTPVNASGGMFDAQTYNFAPDSTPPSAPGSLKATTSSTKNVLTWTAASDNIGVAAYDVYRNGTYLATVPPAVTSYTDKTATSGTGYTYQVAARDLAGNTTRASVNVNGGAIGHDPADRPRQPHRDRYRSGHSRAVLAGVDRQRGRHRVHRLPRHDCGRDGGRQHHVLHRQRAHAGNPVQLHGDRVRRFRQRLPGKQPGGRDHPGGHDAADRTPARPSPRA